MRAIRFSRTPAFAFEALRGLWTAAYDGGEFGEVAAVMARVRRGDFESWFREWSAMADRVAARGRAYGEPVSRGTALLRAANYRRQAEFFLDPADPRRAAASTAGRELFDAGLDALGTGAARIRIPYDGADLEALFLRPADPDARTVLVVQGGFDSTLEELYFMLGAAAVRRGHCVLMFTGPGQGSALREHGMPFTPEWERPTRAVLDWLDGLVEPRLLVGAGISFGGHLLARAAAFEPRYDGIVLYDHFPGMLTAFLHNVPRPVRGAFERMPWWMRRAVPLYGRFDAQARWGIGNALWTFGADTLPGLVDAMRPFDDREWAGEITADALVLLAEREHFYDPALGREFADRLTGARSVRVHTFTEADGGHLHCQNGALQQAHEVIFDWVHGLAAAAPRHG
ncbi:alpha/beta hydrolase family protein [Actinomadura verrucosospora]|uniref:Dipeptidyl aminopeptidase/acylaminoacyl peptidase n=1 Tax=Actinomadura verrucosospora TaxID=46165 RepID=A0A7D4A6M5_ACTVE|nr:alpha/beta hydrolase [Actinomadura verrucosospora]QKG23805.1 dipeptidyl aminopeptidase/acylaminoacyl peptidase [Actinomadura verrucosospora]